MNILLTGNIAEYTRNMKMAMDWQKKQSEGNYTQKAGQTGWFVQTGRASSETEMYSDLFEQIRENEQPPEVQAIYQKLQSGKELSAAEMKYLEENDFPSYLKAREMQAEREAYERELKECKTKEDVERVQTLRLGKRMASVNSIANNPHIPEGVKAGLLLAENAKIQADAEVLRAFKNSLWYRELPTEQEVQEEAERKAEALEGEKTPETEGLEETEQKTEAPESEKTPEMEGLEETENMQNTGNTANAEMIENAVAAAGVHSRPEKTPAAGGEDSLSFEARMELQKTASKVEPLVVQGRQAYQREMELELEPKPGRIKPRKV